MFRDELAARLPARPLAGSRRGLLAGLTGGVLAAWPLAAALDEAAAKKNRKRKKRGKKKQKDIEPPVSPPPAPPSPEPPPPPPPPGPVTRADAACPGPGDNDSFLGAKGRLAQTFTALASGPLVNAQLGLNHFSEPAGDYILRLSPVDAGGVPTNDVLAAAFLANSSVPEGVSDVTFAFTTPFSVVAGVKYALVLIRPTGNFLGWISRSGDACLGQRFLSEGQSAPFELFGNGIDFIYTTFVSS